MNSDEAFAFGEANRGKDAMVFDWNEAARLILSSGTKSASAGLKDDWEWTGGVIFECGAPVIDSGPYLLSTWAVPGIMINGKLLDCYVMQSEAQGWDAGTIWPQSALDILEGKNE